MTQIRIFSSVAALADAAAGHVAASIERSIARSGRCALALSGGSTPRELYRRLASAPLRERIAWDRVYLFWGDERAVPPDHPDSNYRMAHEAMLSHLSIPPANVYRMPGEAADLEAAAEEYEAALRRYFSASPAGESRFQLVLLGLGPDGHTASLFPGSPALNEVRKWVVATPVAPLNPPIRRLTLTYTILDNAAQVIFLVTGANKAGLVREILAGGADDRYPAARIHPADGETMWMLDAEAGREVGDLPEAARGG